jgi:hypothetical protein
MAIINLAATQVTSAIDMKSAAGLKKKDQYQAKMDDPVHMDLIADNVDDFPELAIILLQIEKLSDDLNNVRLFADSIKTQTLATMDVPTITEDQGKAIVLNTAKPSGAAFTALETDYGPTTMDITHTYDKKSNKHALELVVSVPMDKNRTKWSKFGSKINLE